MTKLLLVIAMVMSTSVGAVICPNGDLYESNRITLWADGQVVEGKIIGQSNPCDGFGGVEVYTPQNGIRVYVNFNISGNLDLNRIDAVFNELVPLEYKSAYADITLAFSVEKQFKRFARISGLPEGVLGLFNLNGQTFFISERAIWENKVYSEVLPLAYRF